MVRHRRDPGRRRVLGRLQRWRVRSPSGDAVSYGDVAKTVLNQPVVGVAPTIDGRGYWLDAADGGIFSFGDAASFGG